MQLCWAGKGHGSRAADNSSREGLTALPRAASLDEEAPGNARGRIRTSEKLQPLCSLVCSIVFAALAS